MRSSGSDDTNAATIHADSDTSSDTGVDAAPASPHALRWSNASRRTLRLYRAKCRRLAGLTSATTCASACLAHDSARSKRQLELNNGGDYWRCGARWMLLLLMHLRLHDVSEPEAIGR